MPKAVGSAGRALAARRRPARAGALLGKQFKNNWSMLRDPSCMPSQGGVGVWVGMLSRPVMSGVGLRRNRVVRNAPTIGLCVALLASLSGSPARGAPDESSEGAEKLFATSCGWCHSEGGREAGKGPKLAGTQRSDQFIVDRIKHGKPGQMPGFAASLNDEQIAALLRHIRSLPSG